MPNKNTKRAAKIIAAARYYSGEAPNLSFDPLRSEKARVVPLRPVSRARRLRSCFEPTVNHRIKAAGFARKRFGSIWQYKIPGDLTLLAYIARRSGGKAECRGMTAITGF
jgi:hypothetical protein